MELALHELTCHQASHIKEQDELAGKGGVVEDDILVAFHRGFSRQKARSRESKERRSSLDRVKRRLRRLEKSTSGVMRITTAENIRLRTMFA